MIAYAMLYAVAVGLPILLAALVGSAFLRKHGRAERGVWLLALVMTLALPVVMLSRPPVAVPTPWTPVLKSVAIDLAPVVVLPAVTETPPVAEIQGFLIALWLLASFSLATRWVVSSARLTRLRRSWHTEILGGVRVSLAPNTGPGVFGIVRPRIVVPSWVATLPDPQRALVLRHEQEHLRGGDHWLAALSRVARILAPWHPIVWLLTSRLGRAMELDCDRRVLQQHPDVAIYGATLLLVSARGANELLAAAAFAESDVSLRRRILAMTTPPRTLSAVGLALATGLGVVLLTGALEVPVPAMDAPAVRVARPLQVPAPRARPVSRAAPVAETTATAVPRQVPQQQLREPRVIANPLVPRMTARLLQPGPGPGIRVQVDTIWYTIDVVGDFLLGPEIVGFEMARAALAGR